MSPARRLLLRTLSSHRERARRECSRVRAGALAVWPPPEPERAAERHHFRVCGHKQGTSTFPVHQHNEATRRAVSCFTGARATKRRVDPTATRTLPRSVSPTLRRDRMSTSEAAHAPWSQTLFMHPRPPVAQPPAAQARPSPHTPRRPVYGSGRSPDAASAASRHFAQRKRETSACDREIRRAVAVTFTPCGGIISQGKFFCPRAPPVLTPPYTWRITHAKWNLLRRIEHGNTAARKDGAMDTSAARDTAMG